MPRSLPVAKAGATRLSRIIQSQSGKSTREILDGLASTLDPKYNHPKIKSVVPADSSRVHSSAGGMLPRKVDSVSPASRPGRHRDILGIVADAVSKSKPEPYDNTPKERFSEYSGVKAPVSKADEEGYDRLGATKFCPEDMEELIEEMMELEEMEKEISEEGKEEDEEKGGKTIKVIIELVLGK